MERVKMVMIGTQVQSSAHNRDLLYLVQHIMRNIDHCPTSLQRRGWDSIDCVPTYMIGVSSFPSIHTYYYPHLDDGFITFEVFP